MHIINLHYFLLQPWVKPQKVCEVSPVDPLFSCQTVCSCSFSRGSSGCGVKKFAKMSPARLDWVCQPRLCWQGGHRPVRRAGGRQAIASKPDRPSSCKIRHLTPPLSIPPLSLILGTSWLGTVHYCIQHAEQFLPPRIHPYEPSWCLTPFVN